MNADQCEAGGNAETSVKASLLRAVSLRVGTIFLEPGWKFIAVKKDQIVVLKMLLLFDRSLGIQFLLFDFLVSDEIDKIVEVRLGGPAGVRKDRGQGLLIRSGMKPL